MCALQITHVLSAAAVAASALLAAPAQAYSGLFVFGDSVSDSGNVALASMTPSGPVYSPLPDGNSFVPSLAYAPQNPSYTLGTLSNGPVWTTQLAGMLGLSAEPAFLPTGGTNFAFGGARVSGADDPVPTLTTQLGYFLGATGGSAPTGALYIVQGGANDARDAAQAVADGAELFTAAGAAGAAYAAGIGSIVDSLQGAGAQNILVFNTPNIGVTPYAATVAGGAYVGSIVAGVMNGFLANRMAGEAGVSVFDSYTFLSGAVMNPGLFGFANVTDACGAVVNGVDCDTALFWDGIHPTAKMHTAIAGAVFAQVVPEPATYGLMALGLLLVGAAARRRASRG